MFSGVANPVVVAAQLDVPVNYEGFQAIGSGMEAAGFIVYDDTTCMVDTAYRLSRFLSIESCGQCPPCKIGSSAITEHLERIETGGGSDEDIASIGQWLDHVTDGNRCYLAVEEQVMVSGVLRSFPEEFAEHLDLGRCPRPRRLPIPSSSTSSTAWPPTTTPTGESDRTGPTTRPDDDRSRWAGARSDRRRSAVRHLRGHRTTCSILVAHRIGHEAGPLSRAISTAISSSEIATYNEGAR